MKFERVYNAKRNVVFMSLEKVSNLLLPFLVRAVIIRKIGAEYLGLNNLFASILGVLSLSELGFSGAVVQSMYKPIAENDSDTICALLGYYRNIYRTIGTVIVTIGLALIPFLPKLISGNVPEGINIYILYLMYLASTSLGYFLFAYRNSLLLAHQRQDRTSLIIFYTKTGMYISQIVVILFIADYYLYALMIPVFTLLNNLLTWHQTEKLFPQYHCRGEVSPDFKRELKKQVLGIMSLKLVGATRWSFDSVFISYYIGLVAVAVYGNYSNIVSGVYSIIRIIDVSLLAIVGNYIVCETVNKNFNILMRIAFIYMWIASVFSICMLCLYQPFMTLWVGSDMVLDNVPMIMFVCMFYVIAMANVITLFVDAAGLWWRQKYVYFAGAACNLLLNYLLIGRFGIGGAVFATFFSELIFTFFLGTFLAFKEYFRNVYMCVKFYGIHIMWVVVTMLVGAVTFYLSNMIKGASVITLIQRAGIALVIPNIIYLMCFSRTRLFKQSMMILLKQKA